MRLLSSCEEGLVLDADNVPLQDPSPLFDHSQYRCATAGTHLAPFLFAAWPCRATL